MRWRSVAVITALSNLNTIRSLSTLAWNGLSMTKAAEQGHDDQHGNATTITICTLKNPPSGTAGAILATYNANITDAQIRFYNVEGCPNGAANAFGTDVDDASGGTTADISIAPTVTDTLCIMGVVQLSSANTHTFSPLTENDDRITAAAALCSAIASGTLASAGAQSVTATLSAANEFSAVAIALSGTASAGTVGRGLIQSVLLERRSLVG